MHNLSLYPSIQDQGHSVRALCTVDESHVTVHFEVIVNGEINSCSKFTKGSFENWGLWEFDVVEVFLSRHETCKPYLEVQLSPLEQSFALIIKEPRKVYQYPESLNIEITNCVAGSIWKSSLKIELKDIPGEGEIIFGNLHCCLGKKENRQYFALTLSDRIDFHRPEYFVELGKII